MITCAIIFTPTTHAHISKHINKYLPETAPLTESGQPRWEAEARSSYLDKWQGKGGSLCGKNPAILPYTPFSGLPYITTNLPQSVFTSRLWVRCYTTRVVALNKTQRWWGRAGWSWLWECYKDNHPKDSWRDATSSLLEYFPRPKRMFWAPDSKGSTHNLYLGSHTQTLPNKRGNRIFGCTGSSKDERYQAPNTDLWNDAFCVLMFVTLYYIMLA